MDEFSFDVFFSDCLTLTLANKADLSPNLNRGSEEHRPGRHCCLVQKPWLILRALTARNALLFLLALYARPLKAKGLLKKDSHGPHRLLIL